MPKTNKLTYNKEAIENIKNKLLDILEITQEHNYFTLYALDNDKNKQEQILALEEDIKKNFPVGNWAYFRNKKKGIVSDRPYLNLIRGILNECSIPYVNKNTTMKIDGEPRHVIKYIIN